MGETGEGGGVDREDSLSADGCCTAAAADKMGLPEKARGCKMSWAVIALVRRTWLGPCVLRAMNISGRRPRKGRKSDDGGCPI